MPTPKTPAKKSNKRQIDARTRAEIVAQACKEIEFDRDYKKQRIEQWHRSEALLSMLKENLADQRSNTGIACTKAIGFLQTLLSKVKNAPNIKFVKTTEADLTVAKNYNGLFHQDMGSQNQNLDFKDLIGKKKAIVYGRAIYDYHASSPNGNYEAHLNYVSCYDFLIDPAAGGLDIERARHLGRAGIWKDKWELEQKAKSGLYISAEVKKLTEGKGDSNSASKEQIDKEESIFYLSGERKRFMDESDSYHFHEWGTTYKGERYYLLLNEDRQIAVRVEKLSDMFNSNLWWYWTWATDPDDEEFWSLAPMDAVINIFIAQGINIDQALDNNERINHPMIGVTAGAVKNLSDLRYGRDKRVLFKKGTDMRTATKTFETPQIDNPLRIYDALEGIGNLESGVNAGSKGASDEEKVGIYEGNMAQAADRLGLYNKSQADGYHRFGKLYKFGVEENLTKKTAVEILGSEGIEFKEVKPSEMKSKKPLKIAVEASDAEIQADFVAKKTKLTYLASKTGNQNINQRVKEEMEAEIVGMSQDEINRLLDVNDFANAELMAEAAQEINQLIDGKEVQVNLQANSAFMQKFVDYMMDNRADLSDKQWKALEDYVAKIKPIVVTNAVAAARKAKGQMLQLQINNARSGQVEGTPQVMPDNMA